MKNQHPQGEPLGRPNRYLPALAGLLLLITTATAAPGQVLPPASHAFGKTYAEWLVSWWQWSLSFPVSADPEFGTADLSANQSGRVWFLPAPLGGATATRSGNIPAGTALFVPVLTLEADNTGCPTYTDFSAEQLAGLAQGGWSFATATSCTIDGVPVPGMDNPQTTPYLVRTPPFSYTVASQDNVLANYPGFVNETCIPDGIKVFPTVAQGVCVLIAPLPVGPHKIHIAASVPAFGIAYDVTFVINVVP